MSGGNGMWGRGPAQRKNNFKKEKKKFRKFTYALAFRLFVPPLKNSAEKEDLPSSWFPISSVVLRLYVGQHICI
jgi:hypothetical protein